MSVARCKSFCAPVQLAIRDAFVLEDHSDAVRSFLGTLLDDLVDVLIRRYDCVWRVPLIENLVSFLLGQHFEHA